MVNVIYTHRVDGTALQEFRKTLTSQRDIEKVIDDYPWKNEIELSEEHGEGGGLYFFIGDEDNLHASFQLVPVDIDQAFLFLNIVAKKGFLGVIGNKSTVVDFDVVTTSDAKTKINQLLTYSIDALYEAYKNNNVQR